MLDVTKPFSDLVGEWFGNIEHNENEVAGSCRTDHLQEGHELAQFHKLTVQSHLTTTTFAILGTLDDSRQVKQLNFCPSVNNLT